MTGHIVLHSAAGLITVAAAGMRDVTGTAEQLQDLAKAIDAAVRRADQAKADREPLPVWAPIDDPAPPESGHVRNVFNVQGLASC